jgi:hypothetical protein
MGGRAWPRMVGATALLVLATACSGARRADGPTATVRTEPETTTTTNPYAVPAVIDAAYVNRVLAGLDQAVGDVVRLVVRSRTLPPEAVDRLRALYSDPAALQFEIDLLQDSLADGLAGVRPDPGNVRTNVVQLLTVKPRCLFVKVSRDSSAVAVTPDPRLSTQWMAVVPARTADGPSALNPTGWTLIYEGYQRDLSAPPDPCARS